MPIKRRNFLILIVNIALFFTVILFHTSEIINLSILNATPMLLLPLITAFAIFSPMSACIIASLISGALIDSVAQGYCFNTLVLLIIAVCVNLFSNSLFNKNLISAIVLSLISSGGYYFLIWGRFHIIGKTVEDSLGYLFRYALPSAVYSALFIFPFYYLYKYLNDK